MCKGAGVTCCFSHCIRWRTCNKKWEKVYWNQEDSRTHRGTKEFHEDEETDEDVPNIGKWQ